MYPLSDDFINYQIKPISPECTNKIKFADAVNLTMDVSNEIFKKQGSIEP